MATYSSIFAWRILWTEEPGRLQAVGLHTVNTTERLTPRKIKVHSPLLLTLPVHYLIFLKICSFQNISTYFAFCPCDSSQELSPTKMFHSCVCECLLQTSPPQRQYSLKLSARNNNHHSESFAFTSLRAVIIFYPVSGLLCSWLSSFTIETRMLLHLPLNLSHTRCA